MQSTVRHGAYRMPLRLALYAEATIGEMPGAQAPHRGVIAVRSAPVASTSLRKRQHCIQAHEIGCMARRLQLFPVVLCQTSSCDDKAPATELYLAGRIDQAAHPASALPALYASSAAVVLL